jgi:hypothetical protein
MDGRHRGGVVDCGRRHTGSGRRPPAGCRASGGST